MLINSNFFIEEYQSRRRKAICRILSFTLTAIGIIYLMIPDCSDFFEELVLFPAMLGGMVALIVGKLVEDGIFSAILKVFAAAIRLVQNVFVIVCCGLFGMIFLATIISYAAKPLVWLIENCIWVPMALSFIPFILSVVFTISDIMFLAQTKEQYKRVK